MNLKLLVIASVAISFSTIHLVVSAQTNEPVSDWKPAPSNQGGKEYPQFNSEGRVKFRVVAPKAQSVGVRPFNTRTKPTRTRFFDITTMDWKTLPSAKSSSP